jgi:hypothetical protein
MEYMTSYLTDAIFLSVFKSYNMEIKIEKWNNAYVNTVIVETLNTFGVSYKEESDCFVVSVDSAQEAYNLGDLIGSMVRSQI